jgi:hypothetical protein
LGIYKMIIIKFRRNVKRDPMPDVTLSYTTTVTMPDRCPVCMQPADRPVTLRKTVMRLVHAYYVRQQVTYCPTHAAAMHKATAPLRLLRRVGTALIVVGCGLLAVWFAVAVLGVRGLVRLLGVALLSGIPSAWLVGHWRRLLAVSRDWLIHPAHRATYNALRIGALHVERGRLCAVTFQAANLAYAVQLAAANDVPVDDLG